MKEKRLKRTEKTTRSKLVSHEQLFYDPALLSKCQPMLIRLVQRRI